MNESNETEKRTNAEKQPLEIERRWMVHGWPSAQKAVLLKEEAMRQGYVTVKPAVRIREESRLGSGEPAAALETVYKLCLKSGSGIARQEVEFPIEKQQYDQIETLIGLPLISKIRRTYRLTDGSHLEVNHVDEGLPSEFWYAEIEYDTVEQGKAWRADSVGLDGYLNDDITDRPGQSMAAYWAVTRLKMTE